MGKSTINNVKLPEGTHLFFRVQTNNFFSVNLSACLLAGRWPAHGFEFHFGFSKKTTHMIQPAFVRQTCIIQGSTSLLIFMWKSRQCPLFDGFEAGSWANTTCPWSGRKLSDSAQRWPVARQRAR